MCGSESARLIKNGEWGGGGGGGGERKECVLCTQFVSCCSALIWGGIKLVVPSCWLRQMISVRFKGARYSLLIHEVLVAMVFFSCRGAR